MKSILIVVAPFDFQDFEYSIPKDILEKEGFVTKTASTKKQAKGKYGKAIEADLLLENVNVNDFDGIILVGGPGASVFLEDKMTHKILQDFFNAKKLTSAICMSPLALGKAGILQDQKATVHDSCKADLEKIENIEILDEDVVESNNVITACGPQAAQEFGEIIVKYLRSHK